MDKTNAFIKFGQRIKRKCVDELHLHFCGLDGWNRPIFADKNIPGMFFGDPDHLFDFDEHRAIANRVKSFYEGVELDKCIFYFGAEFDCKPWGKSLSGVKIELVLES